MTRHHLGIATLAAALGAAGSGPCAAETGPYYIGGAISYAHQSNVLGLSDDADIGALSSLGYTSKADNVTSYALIGGLDQLIGRQHLFGDVTLRHNRYAHNTLLDNTSYSLRAGLDWETIEHLSGNLTLKTDRQLIKYGTFEQPTGTKNLVTTKQADFIARLGGVTRLTFEAGAGYSSIDYSDASYDPRELSQSYGSLGVRYLPSGTNYVGLTVRDGSGKYPHFVGGGGTGDHFDRLDVDLTGYLQLSGQTSIYARASHSKIDYDQQTRSNFSGFTGLLRASWQPTGKLKLSADLARDRGSDLRFLLDQFGTEADTATVVNALRARANYELTAKVALNANVGYTRRPVRIFNSLFNLEEDGREIGHQYGLGISWTPTRTSQVGCDYAHERRHSDVVNVLNVTTNVVSCYAQLTLQP